MKRKLISQGLGGYTIYLPKKWVELRQLSAGDEVDIGGAGTSLIVSPSGTQEKSTINISIRSQEESAIRTQITNAYRAGYDIVDVSLFTKEQFVVLQEIVRSRLIGYEITKQEELHCTIENLTEPTPDQFDTILRKIFYSISESFDVTLQRMQGQIDVDYASVSSRVQRYDNFCRRVLAKEKLKTPRSELLWTFLAILIHAQRELHHLNKYIHAPVSAEIIDFLKSVKSIFETIQRAYFKKDAESLQRVHDDYHMLFSQGCSFISRCKPEENILFLHLLFSLKHLYLTNSPLLGWQL